MTSSDLKPNEYHPYYQLYIDKAKVSDLKQSLKLNLEHVLDFFQSIPESKLEYRYAEGKWTIKEIVLHMIDTERIFAYRALRIARYDQTPLSGFEQDDYVPVSNSNHRSFESLIHEYKAVREATIALFNTFGDEVMMSMGIANDNPISVRAIGFIMLGHENHHCEVIKQKYL